MLGCPAHKGREGIGSRGCCHPQALAGPIEPYPTQFHPTHAFPMPSQVSVAQLHWWGSTHLGHCGPAPTAFHPLRVLSGHAFSGPTHPLPGCSHFLFCPAQDASFALLHPPHGPSRVGGTHVPLVVNPIRLGP